MIKLSKLTDYGFVLLTQFAAADGSTWLTARDLSDSTGLPLPTVSKLLKVFSKNGMLLAQRGMYGGYRLAQPAADITAADVIELLDGPIGLTDCSCSGRSEEACSIEEHCPTRPHWQRISQTIRSALSEVTLFEMAAPPAQRSLARVTGRPSLEHENCGGSCAPRPGQPCQCGHDIQSRQDSFSGEKK